jgi:hypothetical protein
MKKCRQISPMHDQWAHADRLQWKLLMLVCLLIFPTAALPTTVDAFVTEVKSPTVFQVGALNVALRAQTKCQVRNLTAFDGFFKGWTGHLFDPSRDLSATSRSTMKTVPCSTLAIRIGSRVRVEGDVKGVNPTFVATWIIVYAIQNSPKLEGGAILEEEPQLHQTAEDWIGTIWADGYPMTLVPQTKLLGAPENARLGYLYAWKNPRIRAEQLGAEPNSTPFSSIVLHANTYVTYNAMRTADGTITAKQLRLWPNKVGAGETKYLSKFAVMIRDPDYRNHVPGVLKFRHTRNINILPDQLVQEWVSRLGNELIPQYQKNLPQTNVTKIQFRFYVVQPYGSALNNQLNYIDGGYRRSYDDSVVAMPNGMIIIPDTTLSALRNKSQLAALLSYAIAAILQKQSYIAKSVFKSAYPSDLYTVGLLTNEQKLRLGIRAMFNSGYDIREAPFAWADALREPIQNPITHAADSKIGSKDWASWYVKYSIYWYAAYAFNYISQYYRNVDYSKLKRGEAEYRQFLEELYKADPTLKPPKAQATKQ